MRNKSFYRNMRQQLQPSEETKNALIEKLNQNSKNVKSRSAGHPRPAWRYGLTIAAILLVCCGTCALFLTPKASNVPAVGIEAAGRSTAQGNASLGAEKTEPSRPATEPHTSVQEGPILIPKWDERDIVSKFTEFQWNGKTYTYNAKIDAADTNVVLGTAQATGYDIYTDRQYTHGLTIYPIDKVVSDCAVAVKYAGEEGLYCFVDSWYQPKILKEFVTNLNLRENLEFGPIYYDTWKDGIVKSGNYLQMEYTLPDPTVIWDLLFDDLSVPAVEDSWNESYQGSMDIAVNVKAIGSRNLSLSVTQDGYLTTNILHSGKGFYIGKEKAEAFAAYVLKNGKGKVLYDGSVEPVEPELTGSMPAGETVTGTSVAIYNGAREAD